MDTSHPTRTHRPLAQITTGLRRAAVVTTVVSVGVMVAAIFGGLARMGVTVGATPTALVANHGPLMVCAFFGAVITTERAIAVRNLWSFLAPIAAVFGGFALIFLPTPATGAIFFSVSGLMLVGIFAYLLWQRFEPFVAAMALGAAAWAVGNLLWMIGRPIPEVVPWWAAFLVITIAGERLELSRFRLRPGSPPTFWAGVAVVAVGLIGSLFAFGLGVRLVGVGFVTLAVWLAGHDVARATIRVPGLPRFMALALFAGYVWLAFCGVLASVFGAVYAGLHYDAVWHAVFVGFVFSMVFAHAQVILPAVSGVRVRHGARFYAPLILLHASNLVRIIGDLSATGIVRQAGGIGDALAIAMFIVVLASSVRKR